MDSAIRRAIGAGCVFALLPLTSQAEVIDVAGKVEAFFPGGTYENVFENANITHVAHTSEEDWTFYTLTLYQDHKQKPSRQWFRSFVKGQEDSVQEGTASVINSSAEGGDIYGTFSLAGEMEGAPYEKLCRFIMNSNDYATWCVAAIIDRADTLKARQHFDQYKNQFALRD
ncbi:hypothetical protein [Vreelandella massiliensis]|uniref:hypothetical protein n=1 Tax=Vreelandella massiliensis TaxID=1816686 RepID=UPI00096A9FFD|nr:hypothetical protein [Halomonas massiliensis]